MKFFLVKRILISIVVCCFVRKEQRKIMKDALLSLPLGSLVNLAKFKFSRVPTSSVLIIEGNTFHAEVIPGFVRYFNELGYHVDVLSHQELFNEKPFYGMRLRVREFTVTISSLKIVLMLEKLKSYDYALINTLRQCVGVNSPVEQCFKDVFGTWPPVKKNVFYVAHDTAEIDRHFPNADDSMREHAIMLGEFTEGHMVNSHYFGTVKARVKNEITRFVMIGTISPEVRNTQQLIDALCKLKREGYAFSVHVIGRGSMENIPAEIQDDIHIMGRLNFPDMYQQLREADFILACLDADNIDHERYITTGVTGTAQLCYGFELMPVIEEKFAAFYGFTPENAIIYKSDLGKALCEAIDLSEEKYNHKKNSLTSLATNIRNKSIFNFKNLLESR